MRGAGWCWAVVIGVAGCGRIGFDDGMIADAATVPQVDADALARCVTDDFADGDHGGWIDVTAEWVDGAATGSDGSPALSSSSASIYHTISHPALAAVSAARVSVDFNIFNPDVGDFVVTFVETGHLADVVAGMGFGYRAALYPVGSDSGPDFIQLTDASGALLDTHPVTLLAPGWHHADVALAVDAAVTVGFDGDAGYLRSPPDATIPGPFDVAISFWTDGAIDNVVIDCAH